MAPLISWPWGVLTSPDGHWTRTNAAQCTAYGEIPAITQLGRLDRLGVATSPVLMKRVVCGVRSSSAGASTV